MDETGFLGFDTDSFGYPLAEQPHPDAYFDPMWRSRHGPKPMDGWRFAIRCAGGCPDGVGSISATRDPKSLQSANPIDLDFLGSQPASFASEKALHRLLAAYHHRAEWFHLKPRLSLAIRELCG